MLSAPWSTSVPGFPCSHGIRERDDGGRRRRRRRRRRREAGWCTQPIVPGP